MPAANPSRTYDLGPLVLELQQSSLRHKVSLPDSNEYDGSNASYFSQQEQVLRPAAIVFPENADDVASIVRIISKYYDSVSGERPCFAVRSGGKAPPASTANINGGITIDLSKLNKISAAADRQTVTIGTGAKWGDVYPVLDRAGLGIAGGRDATIGVGGLTLGGGLSFFSPQRGFVCDGIVSFEIVLASGEVVTASQTAYSDLWKALKGGSSNFGIVTSFVFQSFDLGSIWGGQNVYSIDTASQHLDAIYEFTADPSPDPHASLIQSFAIYQGNVIVNEGLRYTKPVENPPAFGGFLAIQPVMYSSNKLTNMTDAAIEQSGFNQLGRRQALMTTTFVNDRDMIQYAFDAWHASVPSIQKLTNVHWSTTFQPLSQGTTQTGQSFGGNVLGLEGAPALILTQIAITWDDAEDDDFLINKALAILNDIDETAKSQGLFNRFKYLNYAWPTQTPIEGYGSANEKFMQDVSMKYDPQGVFQRGLPGGFKLFTSGS